MRRADRLFRIVQLLRGGRLHTARRLAEKLEVSERTIYRDVVDLKASGVPIDGEAGIGYIMREGFDLPPLMFTREEIRALVLGARLVRAFGGSEMAQAAEEALVKIEAVLPEADRLASRSANIFAMNFRTPDEQRVCLDFLDLAIEERAKITFSYRDEAERETARTVWPLGLFFWGQVWTLLAWCELRSDFRSFRVDRLAGAERTGETFRPEAGRRLRDYLARMRGSAC